ncbi:WAT1-related protein At4g08290-like [Phoenix dactylifera]|uniref:WAT1-related protein n=1 Tax=Phoenix dactylifera TaxID=42345 RepID=A0A8B7CL52_PHODC|nr:WAT1-related protein At4g08290-like [Phoenix dactylifera]
MLVSAMERCSSYVLMILSQLSIAVFIILQQSAVTSSDAVSPTILVLYEHLLSATLLSSLALLLDRGRRPRLSFPFLFWAFFAGFLQITTSQLMMTMSLRYIKASFQSGAMNTTPAVVFVLAVACRREPYRFGSVQGQAKLWGILLSAAGATVMVLFSGAGPDRLTSSPWTGDRFIGCLLVGLGILGCATGAILVEYVAIKYSADLTLSAMMNVSGTIQTAIIAALTERDLSSWRVRSNGTLLTIIYGGTVVTGLTYLTTNWCIHKEGPVFTSAFSPLLIVFSFLLEILILHRAAHLASIIGAALVVGGLYLLLWAKSKDYKLEKIAIEGQSHATEGSTTEPLLPNEV